MSLKSVIIDKKSSHAILAMAANEKLVESIRETDGIFESICKTNYDEEICEQLLEQVVLTPNIVVASFPNVLKDAIAGFLKEEGYLSYVEKPKNLLSQVDTLSIDILEGLVKANGHDIPVEEFDSRFKAAAKALDEAEEFERRTGKKTPNLFKRDIIRVFNQSNLNIPNEYTEEEYAAAERRQEVYNRVTPILNAVE